MDKKKKDLKNPDCVDCDPNSIIIHGVFSLGVLPRFFAIIEDENDERITIRQITETIFNELRTAGIPLREPVAAPPASLAGLTLHCVFQFELGTQFPVPFVVAENETAEVVTVVQIPVVLFTFFRSIGVPFCRIIELR